MGRKEEVPGGRPESRARSPVLVVSEDVTCAHEALARAGIERYCAIRVSPATTIGMLEAVRALGVDTIAYREGCDERTLVAVLESLGVQPATETARP